VLGVIRGVGFPAYVTSTFGIWLLGFFLLATTGAHDKAFTANAVGHTSRTDIGAAEAGMA